MQRYIYFTNLEYSTLQIWSALLYIFGVIHFTDLEKWVTNLERRSTKYVEHSETMK